MGISFMLQNFALLLGGMTVFLYGLKLISGGVQELARGRMSHLLRRAVSSRPRGFLVGGVLTALIQSSTATDIMLVGLVEAGAVSFLGAMPVVMGANVGTTVTAQLVSLSGAELFNVTALASVLAFAGLVLMRARGGGRKLSPVLLGFGMIFIGLEIMNATIFAFSRYALFRAAFTVKNPLILILNGFLITGLVQSSSAVSSIIILLAGNGVIGFESSAYLLLGANIGAGLAVIIISSTMSAEAKRVAVFNVLFNVLGAVAVCLLLLLFGGWISAFFAREAIGRSVANFHTAFNLFTALLCWPLMRPLAKLTEKLCRDKSAQKPPKTHVNRMFHKKHRA